MAAHTKRIISKAMLQIIESATAKPKEQLLAGGPASLQSQVLSPKVQTAWATCSKDTHRKP
jgi:hypothetical protein